MNSKYLPLALLAFQTPAFGQDAPVDAAPAEAPITDASAAEQPAADAVPPEATDNSAEESPQEAPEESPQEAPAQAATETPAPTPEPVEPAPAPVSAPPQEEATEQAPTEVAQVETAPAQAETSEPSGATINPRPAGEEVSLSNHPVDLEKSTFKPGTGLTFKSKDEAFSMGIRLRIQFRDELTSEDEEGVGSLTNTFGIRRARLQFKGNVFSKYVKYKAEFALSPRDLALYTDGGGGLRYTPLLSWYTDFTYLRDLSFRVGQYKLLYSRQRVVSSGNQEFVDRNIAQGEFNLDRDIGGQFFSKDLFGLGLFRYYAGLSIGEGRDVYEAEPTTSEAESHQVLGRIEVLPFGEFNDYSEVDFERLDKFRLSVGGAYAFLRNGTRTRGYRGDAFADGGTANFHNVTADLMAKWAGFTLFSDVFFREGVRNQEVPVGDEDGNLTKSGFGGSVQLGYLIPTLPVGVGVRYAGLTPAGFSDQETSLNKEQEIGGTVGWYIAGHELKLQADFFHYWGEDFSTNAVNQGRLQLQVAY